ncbi:MAG TPA: NUDIX domain-containing protein [Candidatus Paceibacterota bacterium]
MTRVPVVDEADEIIGFKERVDVGAADIDRVSALWVTNAKGEVLLAQRAATKAKDPCMWGPAVAGTVEEGETYIENIVKEAGEELGITITAADLVWGPKIRVRDDVRNYFGQYFLCTIDRNASDFQLQKEEVERVEWREPQELKADIEAHPEKFTPGSTHWIEHFL